MNLRLVVCKPFSGTAICCEENHLYILTSKLLSKLANASLCSTRFQSAWPCSSLTNLSLIMDYRRLSDCFSFCF
jgi:hypothetical protein